MTNKTKIAFLLLVIVQAVHSIEEYYGRLWEVFSPAKFVTGLVSNDHEAGFFIINISLFIIGILTWAAYMRNHAFAKMIVVLLSVMEIINSVGHSIWAVGNIGYVPGLATAPFLFALALYIMISLFKTNRTTRNLSAV